MSILYRVFDASGADYAAMTFVKDILCTLVLLFGVPFFNRILGLHEGLLLGCALSM